MTSLVDLGLVLVITFYLLLDIRRLRAVVLRWLDPSHRPGARRVFSEIARVFGAYVRAQLLVALSLGLLVAVVLLALGVPYALFLALFAALAELIPMVGPVVGAVPALLVAATMPLPTVIWVGVAFVFIQLIESNILVPRMVGRAVGIHPIGSILALALGFQLGGVIGALFAVPLAGLLWVLVSTAVGAWRDKRIELQRTVDLTSLSPPPSRTAFDERPRRPQGRSLRGVTVTRAPTFEVVDGWEQLPAGYSHPDVADVAVDSSGRVYLFCRSDHPVLVYERDGRFVRSWGEGVFTMRAHGITIAPDDTLWFTDDGDQTVRRFTRDGRLLATIGTSGRASDTGYDGKIRHVDHARRTAVQPAHEHRGRPER